MTFPGAGPTRIWVRGRFVDTGKAARGEEARGMRSPVWFDPSPAALLDTATEQILSTGPFAVTPGAVDGYFQILLPATDDPAITPVGWTYEVTEPSGRSYSIVVPLATPVLDAPGDPLHGQQVIDLITVVPAPGPQPGSVQLMTGRGIESMVIDEAGDLIATYTDGVVENLGLVVGGGAELATRVDELEDRITGLEVGGVAVAVVEHVQTVPATVWGPIAHGLGRHPVAWSLYDTDGRECGEYEVQNLDLDTCRVSMDVPTAGVIRLL